MRSLGVRLIAGVGLLAMAAIAQAPAPFQPVGNMSQLMIDIVYPTSDAIFYVDRDPPKNQHEWALLRAQALTLAESGNLLMIAVFRNLKWVIDVASSLSRRWPLAISLPNKS